MDPAHLTQVLALARQYVCAPVNVSHLLERLSAIHWKNQSDDSLAKIIVVKKYCLPSMKVVIAGTVHGISFGTLASFDNTLRRKSGASRSTRLGFRNTDSSSRAIRTVPSSMTECLDSNSATLAQYKQVPSVVLQYSATVSNRY